jgi:hypothetical protein
MTNLKYDKETVALLVIDSYNDFISEGGKIWDRAKAVGEANNCVPHKSVAFISLSSSDSWQIHVWSQRCALPLSLATRSLW